MERVRRMTLRDSLQQLRRRVLSLAAGRGITLGLAAGVALLIVAVWVDLVLDLSGWGRLLADVAGAATTVLVFAGLLMAGAKGGRLSQLARRMDAVAGCRGQILTGWDLQGQADPQAELTQGLSQLAVDRAAVLAGRVSPAAVAPAGRLCRTASSLLGLLIVLGVAAVTMPRLMRTQWLRFADPFGDHPPYSPIVFRVEPGNTQVVYGSGLDISVTAEGGIVDRVDLVLQNPSDRNVETLPMFPEPDGRWRTAVTNVTQSRQYFVRSGRSRSSRYDIGVITVPRLEEVRFKVTPPAYTNRPPYEGPLPQGGLAGLPGTCVQLWIRSNRPLSGGSADLTVNKQVEPIHLQPLAEDNKQVTGTFEIRQAGRLRARLADAAGQASNDEFVAPVALLADQRPFIRILQPPATSFATPSAALPVRISAEDDYGISRQELYRSLNDSRSLPALLPLVSPPPVRTYETVELPLARYGLQPGDVVSLYGRVEDNDPAGAKGSESPIVTVHIVSQEQFERMLRARQGLEVLQSKYEQAHRRLETIAQQIEQLQKQLDQQSPDSPLSQALRDKIRSLADDLRKQAQEIRDAAQHELPYDVDKNFSRHLEDLARSLEQTADQFDSLAANQQMSTSTARKQLSRLAAACKGGQQRFDEEARLPIEYLAKIYPLIEDQARFVDLYQQQRALAERLASLKAVNGQDDPAAKARMRDMESEQQQLRQQLSDLLEQIDQHVAQLPGDKQLDVLRQTASEFAEAVRASKADEAMTQAQSGLAEFNGTQGYANALQAADILEKFIAKCKETAGQGQMCLRFQPKLAAGLGDTVAQLLGDEGFGQGGTGSGDGYSMRRSSLTNVGLYGSLPGLVGPARSGLGTDPATGMPLAGAGSPADRPQSLEVDAAARNRATGSGDPAIPLQYRQRVGEYFKQIAEEQGRQRQ